MRTEDSTDPAASAPPTQTRTGQPESRIRAATASALAGPPALGDPDDEDLGVARGLTERCSAVASSARLVT